MNEVLIIGILIGFLVGTLMPQNWHPVKKVATVLLVSVLYAIAASAARS